jgi:hypothetical protein
MKVDLDFRDSAGDLGFEGEARRRILSGDF